MSPSWDDGVSDDVIENATFNRNTMSISLLKPMSIMYFTYALHGIDSYAVGYVRINKIYNLFPPTTMA